MASKAEHQATLEYELSLERLGQRTPIRSPPQTRRSLVNESSSNPVQDVQVGAPPPVTLSDPLSQYRDIFNSIIGDENTIMGLPIKKIKQYLNEIK